MFSSITASQYYPIKNLRMHSFCLLSQSQLWKVWSMSQKMCFLLVIHQLKRDTNVFILFQGKFLLPWKWLFLKHESIMRKIIFGKRVRVKMPLNRYIFYHTDLDSFPTISPTLGSTETDRTNFGPVLKTNAHTGLPK